jgi:hypothetical protein
MASSSSESVVPIPKKTVGSNKKTTGFVAKSSASKEAKKAFA